MGLFDGAKRAISGNRAYRIHVDGNKLAAEGKPKEAIEKYKTALRLYEEAMEANAAAPNIVLAYSALLMRQGQFDKSKATLEALSRVKTLSKDDWFELRMQYSLLLWRAGELDRAFDTIGRAAAYKMNGNVYSTLGMYWVDRAIQTGDFEGAMKFNQAAMDYDDEDAATLDNMGQLYEGMAAKEGDSAKAEEYLDKAVDYFEKAHKQKPRQITTLYFLARLYHRRGQDDKARKLLSIKDTLYISAVCPVTREMIEALAKEIG